MDLLAPSHRRDVTDLVPKLKLPQPAVSKHLRVLRRAGLVTVNKAGRHRLYELNAEALKPVHDWIQYFERLWTDHLAGIKEAAEKTAQYRAARNRAAPGHQRRSKE